MDKDGFAEFAIFGDSEEVQEQVKSLQAIGIDGIICMVPSPFVTESVVAVGETLSGVL
jgi:alkanesulfonate monooxygenase SsuD/methylene tetrahydromethanopterin reductase-like flavin-dependent oxidoreductase (luciferase family)